MAAGWTSGPLLMLPFGRMGAGATVAVNAICASVYARQPIEVDVATSAPVTVTAWTRQPIEVRVEDARCLLN